MSDHDNSNNGLGMFLSQMSTVFLAIISFISGVYGFIKLFADKDAGLVTLISLAVCILLLLGICLYYARFWQPQRKDQWQSAFSSLSDGQAQAQAKKAPYQQRVRRFALAGLILIPIIILSGVAAWFYAQSLPAKNIIILVADFDGPDESHKKVTETIITKLIVATKKYKDIEIQALEKTITAKEGSKVAQAEGESHKAAIVIWGWYGDVQLSANFEVLHPPKALPELGQTASGEIQLAGISELKSFPFPIRLSNEMTYLSLFTLGMARSAAEDWEGAISRFTDALDQKIEPKSSLDQSAVYFHRGFAYFSQNNLDLALTDWSQAIKLQPDFAEAYGNRSAVYAAKGDFSHALIDANQALKLMPGDYKAYNNRGLSYLQTGEYDQAIADFNQTLKLIPPAKVVSSAIRMDGNQLGEFSISDRKVNFANFVFTELSDYTVYTNRGTTYLSKGDADRALADFNQAIKLRPDHYLAYFNRAAAYYFKQDFDRALVDMNQVIKLKPDHALAYMKRGAVYLFKGNSDRALADLNLVIKLQPDSALSYNMRGEVYAKREEHDRAIADFSQAIKLQPELFSAYLDRSMSYQKKGDNDRAFSDFNQVIKLAPDNAEAYNARGWTYAEKGDFKRSLADLNQALKLKPDEASFYDSRGFAYAGKGDNKRAIADYNHALKLKPDADYAYYHRGIVYRALGDHQKAIADFKKTLELTSDAKRRHDAEKQLQELGGIGLKK